jgi:hypothetical protein
MTRADGSKGHDGASLVVEQRQTDAARWRAAFSVIKHEEDIDAHLARELGISAWRMPEVWAQRATWDERLEARIGKATQDFLTKNEPYEVLEREGNALVNAGINAIWNLVCGAGGTSYANASAHLGVGDSSTATTAGMTDLQAATNKLRKAMNGGFPTSGTLQKATWQASFGAAEANWAWAEWALFNAAAAGTMLNRKAEGLGTKSTGTWTLTVDVSLS